MNSVERLRMYGPALDGSGKIVNRDVPLADVRVYEGIGYKAGSVPEEKNAPSPVKEESEAMPSTNQAPTNADLNSMTKAQLVQLANEQGMDVAGMNKIDILELLKAG